ncbi:MAG: hypothetical protein EOO74_03245 [Myxococcales bacterium]|nr:MAG: hypothetical protein EOO74_03245 [Myxococcales bacterium]
MLAVGVRGRGGLLGARLGGVRALLGLANESLGLRHREQVLTDSESLLSKARREAEQIVSSAKKQAESLRSSGHADSEKELAAIRSEVDRLTKRRDAITAQLGALRDVVSGFGDDN